MSFTELFREGKKEVRKEKKKKMKVSVSYLMPMILVFTKIQSKQSTTYI